MLYRYDGVHGVDAGECPALILHGGADRPVPGNETAAAQKQFRNAPFSRSKRPGTR